MLNRWLARAGLDLVLEDREAAVDGDGAEPHPFKLNFNQYPNLERIEKAVLNSPAAKVVLRKEQHDGQGVASSEGVVLSSTLHSEKKRGAAAKLATGMVRKIRGKMDENEEEVTIEDLEDLVDGSLEGIEWTEGYIQIEDETGLKKIGLEHVDKFFIYPLGSSTPLSDAAFVKAVAAEVVDLQAALGVDLLV